MWSLQSPKMKHFSTVKQGSRKRFDYGRRHEFLNKNNLIQLIDNVYIDPCKLYMIQKRVLTVINL